MTMSPEDDAFYTYLDNNHVRLDNLGCLAALDEERDEIFWCVLYDGEPEVEDGHFNWGLVTAPDPEFLDAVNRHFGTSFKMDGFDGR